MRSTLLGIAAMSIVVLVGCTIHEQSTDSAGVSYQPTPSARRVDEIMAEYADGNFIKLPRGPVSGWIMTNEKGKTFHRALLNYQVGPIVVKGREAVPSLLKWLSHDQMEIRYIAQYSLEEITGQKPFFPHFATLSKLKKNGWLKNSSDTWQNWYERESH